jgi:HAD superfamily hydrolase (TIGR01509 family)
MITHELLADVEAVIVDWDGTVVDSRQANFTALNDALRPYNVQVDRTWYREHAGLSIVDLLAEVVAVHGDLPITTIIAASRTQLLADIDQLRLVPVTIDLLNRARDRGIPCAVASNAIRPLVAGGISALQLGHLFAAIVTREDVRQGKPDPDPYLHAAALLRVRPRFCLAVDDAADGIAAARSAGMAVLTVRRDQLCWPDRVPAVRAQPARS